MRAPGPRATMTDMITDHVKLPGGVAALLDHLDIDDAVLAGLSFGGRVALQAALAAPDRVRGLALLDAVLDGVPWDPSRPGPWTRSPGGSRRAGCGRAARPGWPTR